MRDDHTLHCARLTIFVPPQTILVYYGPNMCSLLLSLCFQLVSVVFQDFDRAIFANHCGKTDSFKRMKRMNLFTKANCRIVIIVHVSHYRHELLISFFHNIVQTLFI